jgi:phage gpG-like protein
MRDSISSSSDATQAVVGTNKPYARIQNSGGTIVQPPRSNLYTQAKRTKNTKRGKKGTFMKGTKAGKGSTSGQRVIDIPARPFMTLPESGVKKVIDVAEKYLDGRGA